MLESRSHRIKNPKLAAAIAARCWSYTEAAKAAGVSRSTISYFVRGKGLPRIGTAYKIADALGVDVSELGWGLKDMRHPPALGEDLTDPSTVSVSSDEPPKPPFIQTLLPGINYSPPEAPPPSSNPTRLLSAACDFHLVLLGEMVCSGYSLAQAAEVKIMASKIMVFIQSTHTELREGGS